MREQKKVFCQENYTTLWPNRFITDRHPGPLFWGLENSPLAGHTNLHSPLSCTLVLQAVTLSKCPKAGPHCHHSRQIAPLETAAFRLEKNTGIFRKGASAFVPWCHHPVVPPN